MTEPGGKLPIEKSKPKTEGIDIGDLRLTIGDFHQSKKGRLKIGDIVVDYQMSVTTQGERQDMVMELEYEGKPIGDLEIMLETGITLHEDETDFNDAEFADQPGMTGVKEGTDWPSSSLNQRVTTYVNLVPDASLPKGLDICIQSLYSASSKIVEEFCRIQQSNVRHVIRQGINMQDHPWYTVQQTFAKKLYAKKTNALFRRYAFLRPGSEQYRYGDHFAIVKQYE